MFWGLRVRSGAMPAIGAIVLTLTGVGADPAVAQTRQPPGARPAVVPSLAQCRFTPDADAALPLPVFAGLDPSRLLPMPATMGEAGKAKADEDEDEDEDGDESEDDTEDSDPPVRGFLALTPRAGGLSGPCYKITGSFAYSSAHTDGTGPTGRFSATQRDKVQKESKATLGLQMLEDTEFGRFRAAFEVEWSASSGTTGSALGTAWMSLGAFTWGLKGSSFDFWSGDEFGFRATAPSASTPLASVALRTGPASTLLVSLEDQQARQMGSTGYSGKSLPDLVMRWRYESEGLTVHAAGALHELNLALATPIRRLGYAAILGIRRDVPFFAHGDYWTIQAAYADTAPGYLGIAQPGGLLRFTLPRGGPVFLMETMRGWTAAAAYSHGWSPTWRSNAFATMADLRIPEGPGRGRIQVGRAALNVVWTPLEGLDLTWELAASKIYRLDTIFGLINYPSHPSVTAQWAISRRF
ncbi:MAG: porin [Beijerinckiaceae bacterium]|nr:porin [Beijerinckiaceae bacterium]